ncbi:MAG: hypothetical protein JST86_07535 [Bacteroidetes bacterium]|nr:hypothetical protein [Bacteroidota bacterium]
MKRISTAGLMAAIIVLASCSSTKVTSSWKMQGANVNSYHKVLVVGMLPPRYRNTQAEMENRMVKYLKEKGINATSAYAEFGPRAFNNKDENKLLSTLRNKGFDAAVTIVLQDKTNERYRSPGTVSYQPVAMYRNRFSGYYSTIYSRYYTPGYTTTNTNYLWETNVYDLNVDQLLYTVQSESFNPSSTESLSKQYAKKVVKDMAQKGVLQKS